MPAPRLWRVALCHGARTAVARCTSAAQFKFKNTACDPPPIVTRRASALPAVSDHIDFRVDAGRPARCATSRRHLRVDGPQPATVYKFTTQSPLRALAFDGLSGCEPGEPSAAAPSVLMCPLLPPCEMERIRSSKSSDRCFTEPFATHCLPREPAALAACSVLFGCLSKWLRARAAGARVLRWLALAHARRRGSTTVGSRPVAATSRAARTDAGRRRYRTSSRRCTRCSRFRSKCTSAPSRPTGPAPPMKRAARRCAAPQRPSLIFAV